jgi:subtilisin family serine protease
MVAQEGRIGPGVLEAIRAGRNPRVVVALNVPELETTPADLTQSPDAAPRTPPGFARRRADIATARRAAIGRARPEALVKLRQYESVPAFAANITSEDAVRAIASDPRVRRISLDVGGTGQLASSVRVIAATERHEVGNKGQGVVIGLLDSGVDSDHPDLSDAVVHEACFGSDSDIVGPGFCPNGSDRQFGPGAAEDDAGHGTFVAGVLTSNGVVSAPGVAPGASIVAIKVTDNCSISGCFYAFSEIVAALDYIIANNATLEIRAINMSFTTRDKFLGACDNAEAWSMAGAAAINTLRAMGVIAFAANGNDGSGTLVGAPACLSNVVAVGATNDQDQVGAFSNSNVTTDIFAPGVSITSDFLGGGTFTSTGSTSAATPHATGCAALLIDSGEALTPAAIETRLETSPVIVTDPKNGIARPRIDCSYSAIAALSALINRVNAFGLPGGSANSYVAPLNQALANLRAGNVTLAQKKLTAFANHVRSEIGDQLTQAQANELLLQVGRVSAGAQKGYL